MVYRYIHYTSNHGNWAEGLDRGMNLDRESSPRFVRLRFGKTWPLHAQSPSKGFKIMNIKPSKLFELTNWPCNQITSIICFFSSPPKKLRKILSLALMAQGGRSKVIARHHWGHSILDLKQSPSLTHKISLPPWQKIGNTVDEVGQLETHPYTRLCNF